MSARKKKKNKCIFINNKYILTKLGTICILEYSYKISYKYYKVMIGCILSFQIFNIIHKNELQ